jgi:hypothetical protein
LRWQRPVSALKQNRLDVAPALACLDDLLDLGIGQLPRDALIRNWGQRRQPCPHGLVQVKPVLRVRVVGQRVERVPLPALQPLVMFTLGHLFGKACALFSKACALPPLLAGMLFGLIAFPLAKPVQALLPLLAQAQALDLVFE